MTDSIKIAVISDIHSNYAALEACVTDAKNKKAEEFIVLGDIINIWHNPNECIDLVKELTPFSVMGPADKTVADTDTFSGLWSLYDEYASYLWTRKKLTEDNFKYISSLPKALSLNYGNLKMLAVHGSPYKMDQALNKELGADLDKLLDSISESILLCGESHCQWKYVNNGKTIVNPGSCGCHFNKNKCAEYAIITIGETLEDVEFCQIQYDVEKYFSDYLQSDLYKEGCIDQNLSYLSMVSGKNVFDSFMYDINKARAESDCSDKGPVPNDIYNKVYNDNYSEKLTSQIVLPLEK